MMSSSSRGSSARFSGDGEGSISKSAGASGPVKPQAGKQQQAEQERDMRLQERERRIFTATQLLGDTLAGTAFGHTIGWLSLLSSVSVTGAGIFAMNNITKERRGFLGMGLCFITQSVFTLSKTIRDMAEAEKLQVLQNEVDQVFSELMAGPLQRTSLDKELKGAVESLRGSTYWLLQSVGAVCGSIGMTVYGLYGMPDVLPAQRSFTTLGIGFVVSSCFFVSNQARDRREAKKWLGMLADDIADYHEEQSTSGAVTTPTRRQPLSGRDKGELTPHSSRVAARSRRGWWVGFALVACLGVGILLRSSYDDEEGSMRPRASATLSSSQVSRFR